MKNRKKSRGRKEKEEEQEEREDHKTEEIEDGDLKGGMKRRRGCLAR